MVNTPNLEEAGLFVDTMPLFEKDSVSTKLSLTLEDDMQLKCACLPEHVVQVGRAFKQVMRISLSDERIVFGVSNCAELIDKTPENVVLCVFSGRLNGEYANQIYYKLIETLCWHYDISLGMVQSVMAMKTLFPPINDLDNEDMECVIVTKPLDEELTSDEDVVVKFCRQHSTEDEPPLIPIIDT